MNPNDTIRLLILNDSRKEAERLISMLRNAGRQTRPQHVESEEVLTKLLQEQAWDLLIGHSDTKNVPPQLALKHIKRLNKDIPVILLTEEEGSQAIVDGIKLGAADVVRMDEDQHLLLVIQRELENHEQRQLRRRAERQFKEAERRSQLLLDSSRDAIAYVQDGMYLYANESFAERFGYDDKDDIECMPIIDMIEDDDQEQVKSFLKEFAIKGEESEDTKLSFTGLRADGNQAKISVEVANAIYDDEPCIQFIMRASQVGSEELEAQINEIKYQDAATELYNRQYLVNQLKTAVNNASAEKTSVFLYIEIDNFVEQIQPAMGVSGSDTVLRDLANVLKEQCRPTDILARFGDNSFSLLMINSNVDTALKLAERMCKKVEDHIIEIEGRTLQTTLSIGVSLINENTSNTEEVMEQGLRAVTSLREENKDGAGNGFKLYEPEAPADGKQDMEAALRAALEKDQFKLLFQPIISLRGSEEEYYEVLLRMLNQNNEEISPYEFLETASQIGVTVKIDRWVILESIKMLSEHRKKGNKTKLIINLSRHSMCDESLLPWLGVAFKAAKLNPDTITFQMSEADITNHLTAAKMFIEGLTKLGSTSSISNFGCSLNPSNTLKHAQTNFVKVDGSFTLDIQNNNESPEALTNLLKMLHEDSRITIVPFVENASVLSILWQAGVHYIQGHYLQAPSSDMNYDFSMDS